MALKLMYITNQPDVARIAESTGVEYIFVDMEYIGKKDRQGGMDTVQSYHTIEDICTIKNALTTAKVLVRVNPIHEATEEYSDSSQEIDAAINAGADMLMLPYFKTIEEVRTFLTLVDGRAKTLLLFETPESVEVIDSILELPGIDEAFIGLNDLSLGYGKKFMYELLADGTVETLCLKFKQKNIPYGFGGIAALGNGLLPAEKIIKEHYRLGSTRVILSRTFCDTSKISDRDVISSLFSDGLAEIRRFEKECEEECEKDKAKAGTYFSDNMLEVKNIVSQIIAI